MPYISYKMQFGWVKGVGNGMEAHFPVGPLPVLMFGLLHIAAFAAKLQQMLLPIWQHQMLQAFAAILQHTKLEKGKWAPLGNCFSTSISHPPLPNQTAPKKINVSYNIYLVESLHQHVYNKRNKSWKNLSRKE